MLFKEINWQLRLHKIIIKTGAIMDGSAIETPLKPKGKANHKVAIDREDEQEVRIDKDASWLKNRGKKHHITDE